MNKITWSDNSSKQIQKTYQQIIMGHEPSLSSASESIKTSSGEEELNTSQSGSFNDYIPYTASETLKRLIKKTSPRSNSKQNPRVRSPSQTAENEAQGPNSNKIHQKRSQVTSVSPPQSSSKKLRQLVRGKNLLRKDPSMDPSCSFSKADTIPKQLFPSKMAASEATHLNHSDYFATNPSEQSEFQSRYTQKSRTQIARYQGGSRQHAQSSSESGSSSSSSGEDNYLNRGRQGGGGTEIEDLSEFGDEDEDMYAGTDRSFGGGHLLTDSESHRLFEQNLIRELELHEARLRQQENSQEGAPVSAENAENLENCEIGSESQGAGGNRMVSYLSSRRVETGNPSPITSQNPSVINLHYFSNHKHLLDIGGYGGKSQQNMAVAAAGQASEKDQEAIIGFSMSERRDSVVTGTRVTPSSSKPFLYSQAGAGGRLVADTSSSDILVFSKGASGGLEDMSGFTNRNSSQIRLHQNNDIGMNSGLSEYHRGSSSVLLGSSSGALSAGGPGIAKNFNRDQEGSEAISGHSERFGAISGVNNIYRDTYGGQGAAQMPRNPNFVNNQNGRISEIMEEDEDENSSNYNHSHLADSRTIINASPTAENTNIRTSNAEPKIRQSGIVRIKGTSKGATIETENLSQTPSNPPMLLKNENQLKRQILGSLDYDHQNGTIKTKREGKSIMEIIKERKLRNQRHNPPQNLPETVFEQRSGSNDENRDKNIENVNRGSSVLEKSRECIVSSKYEVIHPVASRDSLKRKESCTKVITIDGNVFYQSGTYDARQSFPLSFGSINMGYNEPQNPNLAKNENLKNSLKMSDLENLGAQGGSLGAKKVVDGPEKLENGSEIKSKAGKEESGQEINYFFKGKIWSNTPYPVHQTISFNPPDSGAGTPNPKKPVLNDFLANYLSGASTLQELIKPEETNMGQPRIQTQISLANRFVNEFELMPGMLENGRKILGKIDPISGRFVRFNTLGESGEGVSKVNKFNAEPELVGRRNKVILVYCKGKMSNLNTLENKGANGARKDSGGAGKAPVLSNGSETAQNGYITRKLILSLGPGDKSQAHLLAKNRMIVGHFDRRTKLFVPRVKPINGSDSWDSYFLATTPSPTETARSSNFHQNGDQDSVSTPSMATTIKGATFGGVANQLNFKKKKGSDATTMVMRGNGEQDSATGSPQNHLGASKISENAKIHQNQIFGDSSPLTNRNLQLDVLSASSTILHTQITALTAITEEEASKRHPKSKGQKGHKSTKTGKPGSRQHQRSKRDHKKKRRRNKEIIFEDEEEPSIWKQAAEKLNQQSITKRMFEVVDPSSTETEINLDRGYLEAAERNRSPLSKFFIKGSVYDTKTRNSSKEREKRAAVRRSGARKPAGEEGGSNDRISSKYDGLPGQERRMGGQRPGRIEKESLVSSRGSSRISGFNVNNQPRRKSGNALKAMIEGPLVSTPNQHPRKQILIGRGQKKGEIRKSADFENLAKQATSKGSNSVVSAQKSKKSSLSPKKAVNPAQVDSLEKKYICEECGHKTCIDQRLGRSGRIIYTRRLLKNSPGALGTKNITKSALKASSRGSSKDSKTAINGTNPVNNGNNQANITKSNPSNANNTATNNSKERSFSEKRGDIGTIIESRKRSYSYTKSFEDTGFSEISASRLPLIISTKTSKITVNSTAKNSKISVLPVGSILQNTLGSTLNTTRTSKMGLSQIKPGTGFGGLEESRRAPGEDDGDQIYHLKAYMNEDRLDKEKEYHQDGDTILIKSRRKRKNKQEYLLRAGSRAGAEAPGRAQTNQYGQNGLRVGEGSIDPDESMPLPDTPIRKIAEDRVSSLNPNIPKNSLEESKLVPEKTQGQKEPKINEKENNGNNHQKNHKKKAKGDENGVEGSRSQDRREMSIKKKISELKRRLGGPTFRNNHCYSKYCINNPNYQKLIQQAGGKPMYQLELETGCTCPKNPRNQPTRQNREPDPPANTSRSRSRYNDRYRESGVTTTLQGTSRRFSDVTEYSFPKTRASSFETNHQGYSRGVAEQGPAFERQRRRVQITTLNFPSKDSMENRGECGGLQPGASTSINKYNAYSRTDNDSVSVYQNSEMNNDLSSRQLIQGQPAAAGIHGRVAGAGVSRDSPGEAPTELLESSSYYLSDKQSRRRLDTSDVCYLNKDLSRQPSSRENLQLYDDPSIQNELSEPAPQHQGLGNQNNISHSNNVSGLEEDGAGQELMSSSLAFIQKSKNFHIEDVEDEGPNEFPLLERFRIKTKDPVREAAASLLKVEPVNYQSPLDDQTSAGKARLQRLIDNYNRAVEGSGAENSGFKSKSDFLRCISSGQTFLPITKQDFVIESLESSKIGDKKLSKRSKKGKKHSSKRRRKRRHKASRGQSSQQETSRDLSSCGKDYQRRLNRRRKSVKDLYNEELGRLVRRGDRLEGSADQGMLARNGGIEIINIELQQTGDLRRSGGDKTTKKRVIKLSDSKRVSMKKGVKKDKQSSDVESILSFKVPDNPEEFQKIHTRNYTIIKTPSKKSHSHLSTPDRGRVSNLVTPPETSRNNSPSRNQAKGKKVGQERRRGNQPQISAMNALNSGQRDQKSAQIVSRTIKHGQNGQKLVTRQQPRIDRKEQNKQVLGKQHHPGAPLEAENKLQHIPLESNQFRIETDSVVHNTSKENIQIDIQEDYGEIVDLQSDLDALNKHFADLSCKRRLFDTMTNNGVNGAIGLGFGKPGALAQNINVSNRDGRLKTQGSCNKDIMSVIRNRKATESGRGDGEAGRRPQEKENQPGGSSGVVVGRVKTAELGNNKITRNRRIRHSVRGRGAQEDSLARREGSLSSSSRSRSSDSLTAPRRPKSRKTRVKPKKAHMREMESPGLSKIPKSTAKKPSGTNKAMIPSPNHLEEIRSIEDAIVRGKQNKLTQLGFAHY